MVCSFSRPRLKLLTTLFVEKKCTKLKERQIAASFIIDNDCLADNGKSVCFGTSLQASLISQNIDSEQTSSHRTPNDMFSDFFNFQDSTNESNA